jgi:TolB-like protein
MQHNAKYCGLMLVNFGGIMKLSSCIQSLGVVTIAALMVSCFSAPGSSGPRQPQFYGSGLAAQERESEIILHSVPGNGNLNVLFDGQLKQTLVPGDSVKIIAGDGQHTLSVNWNTRDDAGGNLTIQGDPLSIDSKSMRYVYNITLPSLAGSSMLLMGKKVTLTQVSTIELAARRATSESKGIEGATIRASEILINDLPRDARLAVLGLESNDRGTAEAVIADIEYHLFNSKKFDVVTRKEMDSIQAEQEFHLSGNVSDESAVSIGNMLGASIVITGRIISAGNSQRLTLQALDVKTAQVKAMANEPF